MAEFCECGSLVIDGRCTNKSCSLRAGASPTTAKKPSAKTRASLKGTVAAKPAAKAANPRRASKCITYNLYDKKDTEPET
ncbi:MAG TPA: hypothetical protein VHT96_09935 [Clostridia bacterium]|nr:hypothetical protein [Clostridia bacterium]